MTTWKEPDADEVERVYRALVAAVVADQGLEEHYASAIDLIPRPKKPGKSRAMWEAMRVAWAAWARFERRAATARSAKRGQSFPVLDDKMRDKAIANVERALTSLRSARGFLVADIDALEDQKKRISILDIDMREQRDRVKRMDALVEEVEGELASLKTFAGIPQIWTRREWDGFISDAAAALLEAGLGSREVAALLTGKPEEEIERATLERFRQRVRRRVVSES